MFDTVIKILITLAAAMILIAILPVSPFQGIIQQIAEFPYLGYLNWFFPVGRCLTALAAWAAAIGAWYLIGWIFRQLGIVGG